MSNINSTFDRTSEVQHPLRSGEMSIDDSQPLLDKESPPPCITFRKGLVRGEESDPIENFRVELKDFQKSFMSTLESWFAKQDEKFAVLLTEFAEIKTSIKFVSDKYDVLEKKSHDISKRVKDIENKLSSPQSSVQRIAELENKLAVMEQKSRDCNIEITNLPDKRGENLVSLIENISSIIKHPLSSREIVAIHRVPQLNPSSTRPKNVVVKFHSQIVRDNFLAAARLKKGLTSQELNIQGTSQKIYINEHLTLQSKNLFRQAREAAKKNGHRFVWTKHGTILVRADVPEPAFAIRSEQDLCKIKPYKSGQ